MGDFFLPELLSMLAPPVIGCGLLLLNIEEHECHRQLLQPYFAPRQIHALQPLSWSRLREATGGLS
jgi:cytochrome P450